MASNSAGKNQIISFNSFIWNLELTVKHGDSLRIWYCITYNGHKYTCQISDDTAKKRNYIYNLKTTMKDALNWYGFDSKNIYFLSNIRTPNIL
jgi:hypothetical protein